MYAHVSTNYSPFIDNANNHLCALEILDELVESWDTIVLGILSRRLNAITLSEYQELLILIRKPIFKDFYKILEK